MKENRESPAEIGRLGNSVIIIKIKKHKTSVTPKEKIPWVATTSEWQKYCQKKENEKKERQKEERDKRE